MWRGFALAGVNVAAFGGAVILGVLAVAASCSGGANCVPNTIFTSIGVLILGSGFLLVFVGFGLRPGRSLVVSPGEMVPPSSTFPPGPSPPAPTASIARSTLRYWSVYLRTHKIALFGVLLLFFGLLMSLGGYLLFFANDAYYSESADWTYSNGGSGTGLFLIGMLLWIAGLVLLVRAFWNEAPAKGDLPSLSPPGPGLVPTMGGGWPVPPPPPPPQYPGAPPPPPPPYPPGAT